MPDPLDLSNSGILDISGDDAIMNISRNEARLPGTYSSVLNISNQYRVTAEQLATFNDNVDRSEYSFTNVSWPKNKVLVLVVTGYAASTAAPTVTGGGLTWTLETTRTVILGNQRVSVYRARTTAAATNQTLTITYSGAQSGCLAAVIQLNNVYIDANSNGDTAFGQVNGGTVLSSATSVDGSLNASNFENNYNATLAILFLRTTSASVVPSTNFTELTEINHGSPNETLQIQFSNQPRSAFTWNWTGAEFCAWIALELRAR